MKGTVKEYLQKNKVFNPHVSVKEERNFQRNTRKEVWEKTLVSVSVDQADNGYTVSSWETENKIVTQDIDEALATAKEILVKKYERETETGETKVVSEGFEVKKEDDTQAVEFPMEEFHKGLQVETQEHPEVSPLEAAQLVLDHLKEDLTYYSKGQEEGLDVSEVPGEQEYNDDKKEIN